MVVNTSRGGSQLRGGSERMNVRQVCSTTTAAVLLSVGIALLAGWMGTREASAQTGQPLPASQVPAALVTAIDAFAPSLGETYSGKNCDAATDEDAGEWCWSLLAISDSCAQVGFGKVASDFGPPASTFSRSATGTWASGNCSPQPPATGTGTASTSEARSTLPGLVILLVVAGATGLLVTRKRPTS